MSELLLFSILGLGAGALVAGLGLGIVLSWRGSGVVNLAAGAMAMFVAYVYWALRVEGILFLPPFAIPLPGGPVDTLPAVLIALLVATALGALLYGVIYRPLRHAPPLAKMVGSAGVLLTLQALVVLQFGSDVKSVPDLLPNGPNDVVSIAGTDVPVNRLLLAGIVLAAASVLAAVFRWTRFGLSTTAAAENERAAILVGLSPNRLSLVNWVLASVVAGAIGIVAAPITQLDPLALAVAVIPALGAALVARFSSFLATAAAGLAIGVLQSLIVYLQTMEWFPTADGLPLPGLSAGLPFVIIAAVMFLRGRSLPSRATAQSLRFPAAPRPARVWLPAGIAFAVTVAAILLLGPQWRQAIIFSLIGSIVCLALVVVTGYIGQTSLLHMALAGTAGFLLARLATDLYVPLWISVAVAIAGSCVVGALASLPSVRVQGVNLAIITLAAAVAIQEIYFKNPVWAGGQAGARVPSPEIAGIDIGPAAPFPWSDGLLPSPAFALLCLVVTTVLALGLVILRRGRLGQRMLAVRANERAAASVGIRVTSTKMMGFTMSAGIAGVAGVLYAFNFGSVTYTRFDVMTAIAFLAFAYLGGISTVTGALVGGVLATQGLVFLALQEWFGLDDRLTLLVAGIAVVATVVLNPDGITGVVRDIGGRLGRRARRRRARDIVTAPPTQIGVAQ
jgi:branched-chain amino acid transport system permease protein